MIDPSSITHESLSALYDEITRDMKPFPIAILAPLQSRLFNVPISMQIETIERAPRLSSIPIYRTEYLPIIPPAKYLALRRSQYKTRAGFKQARNYWRSFHRKVVRTERDVCFVFMETVNRNVEEIMFRPWRYR